MRNQREMHIFAAEMGKLRTAIFSFLLLLPAVMQGQEVWREPEKLNASRISARAPGRLMPRFGLPLHTATVEKPFGALNALSSLEYGELIRYDNGRWISENSDFPFPNWVAWDPEPICPSAQRDRFSGTVPADRFLCDKVLWDNVITQCYSWAAEKPAGYCTVVCGPVVLSGEAGKGASAIPYAFYAVVCKKSPGKLGWKSVAFLIPNRPGLSGGEFKYSQSVNLSEYQTGYDFFHKLPESLEELIEDMTVYELFCPFHEEEENMDPEMEFDASEMEADYLDDLREAAM